MDPIVTSRLSLSSIALHQATDEDLVFAREQIAQLTEEARLLGAVPAAASVHHAMGRLFIERLGDRKSAAACFQNAFRLNPRYRPNLESARRLFAAVGQWPRVVALHEKEQQLLKDPSQRAESLRAQAQILATRIGDTDAAAERISQALQLSPDHPALLMQAIDASERKGDRYETARLLLRAAAAQKDDTQRAQLLRRGVLVLDALLAEAARHAASQGEARIDSPIAPEAPRADVLRAPAAELEELYEEALRKLLSADAKDPVGRIALLRRAREKGSWDEVHRLLKLHADRSGGAADRLASARTLLHKLSRAPEALAEVKSGLDDNKRDGGLHALRCELEQQLGSPDTARAFNERAEVVADKTEAADCKVAAAARMADSLEREQLYSEALASNPGDAAAIALHVRAMAHRDAGDTADRFVALGEALEGHAPDEATTNFLEAAMWLTRTGRDEDARKLGERVLGLFPDDPAALRLLQRTLPGLGKGQELSALLEDVATRLPPHYAVMALLRAAAVVADYPAPEGGDESKSGQARALKLVRHAAELAAELPGIGRGLESWFFLAMRAADRKELSRVLETRAAGAGPTDAAELLVEAAEMSRSEKDDQRAAELLRKARSVEAQQAQAGDDGEPVISQAAAFARKGLLALPDLPVEERVALLVEEARGADTERAAALHAERAALLHTAGRLEEATEACAQSLALGGVDLAVLRRLARIQEQRGDGSSLLEVRLQIAQALPEGQARAEALFHAAEAAEWRCEDPARAEALHAEAAARHPSTGALSALARLRSWAGNWAAAAQAYEEVAGKAPVREKVEALRSAASIRAHRLGQPEAAIALYRRLLADEPGDIEASAELLALLVPDHSVEGRQERAELRGRLASRCQDSRVSAMLRAEIAEDRFASGDQGQGLAEYRRALALNPQDRLSLDLVEEALRAAGQRDLLASHLDFRVAYADEETRASLALQQAELLAEDGQLEKAATAYRTAMGSEELALLAIRGARKLAEKMGDKREQMRLLSKEGGLTKLHDASARAFVAAAQLAEELGDADEARQHFANALDRDPSHPVAQSHMLKLYSLGHLIELVEHYERIGSSHGVPQLAAVAWAQAARLRLGEMKDAPSAYVSAGRALKLDAACPEALEVRADAGAQSGREKDALEALQKRMTLPSEPAQQSRWNLLLGKLHVALGDAEKGLPLLGDAWLDIELPMLAKGAEAISALKGPEWAAMLYRRLTDGFRCEDAEPLPGEERKPAASRAQLTAWEFALGQASETNGDKEAALEAYRRTITYDPQHKAALRRVAELAAETAPEEALGALRSLLELGEVDKPAMHALFALHQKLGHAEQAFCAAAALTGLGDATPDEKAVYDAETQKPLPAELPKLADGAVDRAPILAAGDEGPAREMLALIATELPQVLPPDLTGKADRVKGDNPVRRVCIALSRALGAPEPQLFLPKGQPTVVQPVATEPPGLLVGAEVPRKYPARHQRFLYGRALAHIRRGTHALAGLEPARLGQLVAELARIAAPAGTDQGQLAQLPPADAALSARLAEVLKPVVELQEDGSAREVDPRERIAGPASRLFAEPPPSWDALALALRETAERAAMVICGDPAAAIAVVAVECGGGLEKPEVAQLVRFATTDDYSALRAR